MQPSENSILWRLALSGLPIDASTWAAALASESRQPSSDFRTRLLMRDGMNALARFWSRDRLEHWLSTLPQQQHLRQAWNLPLGEVGFPSIDNRLMDATTPETIFQFFRALGDAADRPARLDVGGSISLILSNFLSRHTEDIVVDEVPANLRNDHALLDRLTTRFGLNLGHFQSHYLPPGWRDRTRSLGGFGKIDVVLVDPYDVLLCKLFSAREKDQDDLRAAAKVIDKQTLVERFSQAGSAFLAEPKLAENARRNWYVVFGEALPA